MWLWHVEIADFHSAPLAIFWFGWWRRWKKEKEAISCHYVTNCNLDIFLAKLECYIYGTKKKGKTYAGIPFPLRDCKSNTNPKGREGGPKKEEDEALSSS